MAKQGASALATPSKQQALFGIHQMYARRLKTIFDGCVVFGDIFCGSGENHVGDEIIDGSPISILKGVTSAIQTFRKEPHRYNAVFVFSDIMPERSLIQLPDAIENFQRKSGLPVDRNHLIVANDHGFYDMPIYYAGHDAEYMVSYLNGLMESERNLRMMLTIDPNGPKALPVDELALLWKMQQQRLTMNLHISATSLKRCSKAAISTGYDFGFTPPNLKALLDIFTTNPHGWFRDAIGADQWVLMMLTRYEPKGGWRDFMLKMSTPECRQKILTYSKTKQELGHGHD